MKNEYRITKQLSREWAKEYHLYGKEAIVRFGVMCCLLLISVAGLVLSLVAHLGPLFVYVFALFTLFSVYMLVFSRFIALAKRYSASARFFGVPEWTRTTEFLGDHIVLTEHTSSTEIRYEQVTAIREFKRYVLVYLVGGMALRLYRDAFTDGGTWEDCRSLLLERCKNLKAD